MASAREAMKQKPLLPQRSKNTSESAQDFLKSARQRKTGLPYLKHKSTRRRLNYIFCARSDEAEAIVTAALKKYKRVSAGFFEKRKAAKDWVALS
ncbi:MAG: hypothetical protein IKL92_04240 [Oscillospiraceae bacterium]|nr:hypothetical protein [Oscillospiraceae bacterium]